MHWVSIVCITALLSSVSPVQASEAVDFGLPDLEGREVRLSDYRGKWVLVNYWATWCPPCLEELAELESFFDRHREAGRAVVLGVNMEDIGLENLREFVDEQFLSYPILRGSPLMPGVLGPISGLPTSYLVSPEGVVVAEQMGPVTERAISKFIVNYEARHDAEERK